MANVIRLKRASGSDPAASDLVSGEPAVRTDTGELFFKKDDGSIAKVAGAGGGPDFKYLALRNAANNGAASYPNADFTLVTSGTTNALTPTAANTLLVSVNGVIQKPNTGTSTPSQGFALSGSTIKFGANISAAPDFILYQESGGIGEPSDDTVSEVKLKVSNSPVNGYFLSAQSGNNGGLTWAAPVATSCTGNSATATALETARTINGTSFDGTANITVTAAAGTLTGNTLNSSVTASSLTSLGDLAGLTVNGDMSLTGANYNVLWDKSDNALEFADGAKATFGSNADLQIYNDSSNSRIHSPSHNLYIRTGGLFGVFNGAGSETMLKATVDGAVELYYDNSIKLNTNAAGIRFYGSLRGIDNEKLELGSSQDLKIYHDGSHNIINGAAGQNLEIQTNAFRVRNQADSESMIVADADSAVELYHDNSKKFETGSHGISVHGEVRVGNLHINYLGQGNHYWTQADSGITYYRNQSGTIRTQILGSGHWRWSDNYKVQLGSGDDLQIYHNGTNSFIENSTGSLYIRDTSGGDVRIQGKSGEDSIICNDDGSVELYHDNSKKFDTTSAGIEVTGRIALMDSSDSSGSGNALWLGAGNDLRIFHDGSNSFIEDSGTGSLMIESNSVIRLRDNTGNVDFAKFVNGGGVELYHNNVKRLDTTSGGVNVTGALTVNGSALTSATNSPAFSAKLSSTVNRNGEGTVVFNSEHLDTDSCYNTSNGRFTPDVAGNYMLTFTFVMNGSSSGIIAGAFGAIRKNGSTIIARFWTDPMQSNNNQLNRASCSGSAIIPMNGSSDFIEIRAYGLTTTGGNVRISDDGSNFSGFKLA